MFNVLRVPLTSTATRRTVTSTGSSARYISILQKKPTTNTIHRCGPSCTHGQTQTRQLSSTILSQSNPVALSRLTAKQSTNSIQTSTNLMQKRGMKVRSAVRKFCDSCSIVKRKGKLYVICSANPKHKQVSLSYSLES